MATKGTAKKVVVKKAENDACCGEDCCSGEACCQVRAGGTCKVEAVVSIDSRGQMVLPKVVRQLFAFEPNEKLAVVVWNRDQKPCCLTLMKVDELADAVRQTYGPVLRDIIRD